VLEAISSDGFAFDPVFIIKGAQIMHQHLNDTDIPGGYMLGSQGAGYSNDDLAFQTMILHFNGYSTLTSKARSGRGVRIIHRSQ
jgi:hypothetical protein